MTWMLLCTIVNAACDFSVFNFNSVRLSSNIDLDNTYLESVLESVFHKDINISKHTPSHHGTSAFLFKLYSVVALHDHGIILTTHTSPGTKEDYASFYKQLYAQNFIEINSPPPQA